MNRARRGFALPGARFLFSYSWYCSNSMYPFFLPLFAAILLRTLLGLSVTTPELIA
jgi:hypothetical protein